FNVTGAMIPEHNITLQPKWNVIGWYGLTNTTASWLIDNITDANTLIPWNSLMQKFGDGYFHGPAADFQVNVGGGVFAFMDSGITSVWKH
ncbi:MAG: hypothetical protein J7K61_06385, partial [Thermoplasmata archaeon]|nr:hypothetical protein [Thermoplasmata archaeon]